MLNNLYIFIINLKKRKDRLKNVEIELSKSELINKNNIIIFDAIDYENAKKEKYNYITQEAYNNILFGKSTTVLPTWGAVGCAISHIKCWDLIVEKYSDKEDNCFLIIEDDLEINDITNFNFKLMSAYFIFKKNKKGLLYQILNRNRNSDQIEPILLLFDSICSNNTPINFIQDLYSITGEIRGTHCYMINKEFIFKKKETLIPFTYQFDIQLNQIENYSMYNNNYYNHIYEINYFRKTNIFNFKNSGVNQSKKFSSDVQIFKPTLNFLKKIFKIPEEACNIISSYFKNTNYNYY